MKKQPGQFTIWTARKNQNGQSVIGFRIFAVLSTSFEFITDRNLLDINIARRCWENKKAIQELGTSNKNQPLYNFMFLNGKL